MQVLVTGASSGIGRATCQALRAAGHTPVGIARDFGKYPEADFATHALDRAALLADAAVVLVGGKVRRWLEGEELAEAALGTAYADALEEGP